MLFTSKTIWQIITRNLGKLQMLSFLLFSFVGFFILIFSCQLYTDAQQLFQEEKDLFDNDYLVLSKKVSALNLLGGKAEFSSREINEIKQKEFVTDLGVFEAGQFEISAMAGGGSQIPMFRTDLFFEAVPDQFIDIESEDWKWNGEEDVLPIIIPKSYLNLYNFGFSQSQGLPQVSENVIRNISFTVRIGKQGKYQNLQSKIVGFSNRLNTILVPESFLKWANEKYASNEKVSAQRLIVAVKDVTDSEMLHFFQQKNYDLNQDQLKHGKLLFYLKMGFYILVFIGLIIILAALWLLIITFQLLVEKNKDRIKNLYLLGFKVSSIRMPYFLLSLFFTSIAVILAMIAVYFTHNYLVDYISQTTQMPFTTTAWPYGVGIILAILILMLNYLLIQQSVKKVITQ